MSFALFLLPAMMSVVSWARVEVLVGNLMARDQVSSHWVERKSAE